LDERHAGACSLRHASGGLCAAVSGHPASPGAAAHGACDGGIGNAPDRAAALAGTKQSALGLARAIDRRFAGWIGAALGAAFVLGCAVTLGVSLFSGIGRFSPDARSAAAWRDLQLANPDPTPALQQSRVAVQPGTGRRYYECVALWAAPAPPPRPR